MRRKYTTAAIVVALAAIVAAIAGSVHAAVKAAPTLVIWTDADRKSAVTQVANQWGAARGVNISVVQKNFGDIRDALGTVPAADAPDVIVGAHDWTGKLAANGLVSPLYPKKATLKQFPG